MAESNLMMLVAGYCERRGWIPVGRRQFDVGEWHVRINGSREPWDGLDQWHVLAENVRYLGMLLFSAHNGTVGGYRESEGAFRAALEADARMSSPPVPHGGAGAFTAPDGLDTLVGSACLSEAPGKDSDAGWEHR